MSKETGGPAFPVAHWNGDRMAYVDTGATLRDYFAAKAMQAFLSGAQCNIDDHVYTFNAKSAWRMADAMLAERVAK